MTENNSNHSHELDLNKARITWNIWNIDTGNLEAGIKFKDDYDLVINVNDAYSPTSKHWFPIVELKSWSYAPFFYVKRLIDYENKIFMNGSIAKEKRILIHCAAGVHRSQIMAACYCTSFGTSIEYICSNNKTLLDLYNRGVKNGRIPEDLHEFYKLMNRWPSNSLSGILLRMKPLDVSLRQEG